MYQTWIANGNTIVTSPFSSPLFPSFPYSYLNAAPNPDPHSDANANAIAIAIATETWFLKLAYLASLISWTAGDC